MAKTPKAGKKSVERNPQAPASSDGVEVFTVPGITGSSTMNRGAYEQYRTALADRQSKGRSTLEEAAMAIAQATGERADELLKKLMRAAANDALPVYEPGKNARYLYGPNHASRVRDFYEEARWEDLNKWLALNEPLIEFRFPDPELNSNGTNRDTISTKQATQGLTKAQILAWPWPGRVNLHNSLSDVPAWLETARVSSGKKGIHGSARWNPAQIAVCLCAEKNISKNVLDKHMRTYFADWLDDWEQKKAML